MKRILLAALLLIGGTVTACAAEKPHAFESEIHAFEAADKTNPPPADAIVFYGSSSIHYWTNLAQSFPDKPVINRGFGGSMMADALYYADRVVLPYKPKHVLIYEGDNDLNAGRTVEDVESQFKALCDKIHAALPETKISYISIKPSPSRWKLEATVRKVNDDLHVYIATKPYLAYIDVWHPLLGPDGKPREELYRDDKLHMNQKGYDIWTKVIAPKL
jgi:lysophospholipase L1-like esterase